MALKWTKTALRSVELGLVAYLRSATYWPVPICQTILWGTGGDRPRFQDIGAARDGSANVASIGPESLHDRIALLLRSLIGRGDYRRSLPTSVAGGITGD